MIIDYSDDHSQQALPCRLMLLQRRSLSRCLAAEEVSRYADNSRERLEPQNALRCTWLARFAVWGKAPRDLRPREQKRIF